jgi:hypothetical protein
VGVRRLVTCWYSVYRSLSILKMFPVGLSINGFSPEIHKSTYSIDLVLQNDI